MLIEEALYSMLAADTGIVGIVGTHLVDDVEVPNIFPVTLPQYIQRDQTVSPSYPALVYSLIGRVREDTHDGPVGIVQSEYEIGCLALKYFQAKQLADATRLALHGKALELDAIYTDEVVNGIYLDDEHDDFIFDDVEHLSLYYIPQKWVIQHREPLEEVS